MSPQNPLIMKKYTVNYMNLKSGNSSTITVIASNLKEAKVLAQRHKTDKAANTFVNLKK